MRVSGSPSVKIRVGFELGEAGEREARYTRVGSTDTELVFAYTVSADDPVDERGPELIRDSLALNGGKITTLPGEGEAAVAVPAVTNHGGVGRDSRYRIDSSRAGPWADTLSVISTPMRVDDSVSYYGRGDEIQFKLTMGEAVFVRGTPALQFYLGSEGLRSVRRQANYVSAPGRSMNLEFAYRVQENDADEDGIEMIAALAGGVEVEAGGPVDLTYVMCGEGSRSGSGSTHKVNGALSSPNEPSDTEPPAVVDTQAGARIVVIAFDENLDGQQRVSPASFVINGVGSFEDDDEPAVTGVRVCGRNVVLELGITLTGDDENIVSYAPGAARIQDLVGNAIGPFDLAPAWRPGTRSPCGGGGGGTGPPGDGGNGTVPPGDGGGGGDEPTVNTEPVITTPGPFEVTENQTRVLRIEAVDADPGDAIRSYAIAGGPDGDRFSIVAHTGVLSFREPPNFEAPADVGSTDPPSAAGDNEYIVVVRVASGPVSRDRTVEQAFAVRVTDAGRESPEAPEAPRLRLALEASLTVEWSEPENPGPPITDYDVQYREGTSGFFINAPHEGTGRTATLTGLEAATLYQVQVRARNAEGTGRWSEPEAGSTLAGPPAMLPFSVPDRGGISLTSQGTSPELRIGYGQVETEDGMRPPAGLAIFSSRVKGILVSEAGVPAAVAVLEGRIFAETGGAVRTGLAMANPNDTAATIAFFFTDSEGIDSGHGTFTLGPREQIAHFLDEAPFNGGSEMLGTFTFTSNLPVAVIALRGFVNERSEFLMTTLPVAPIAVPTTATVYFPHFAAGGGWTTQVILVNPTHAPISGSVQFFGSGSETKAAGAATLTLDDGRTGSTFSYAIPPRSATRLRTSDPAGPLEVGSVRAVPDTGQTAPAGLSIFTFHKDGTTVSEAGVPASTSGASFRIYVEASGTPDLPGVVVRSGIALTNTSDAPTTVSLELTDLDGAATGSTVSLTLPASGHVARLIDEFFPTLTTPFSGILRIASTAPDIATVGLRLALNERDDILVTTTPPVDENAAAAASGLFFPLFVDSGGWTTQFILFSGSPGQTAAGMIRFTGQDGQPLELSVAPTAAPMIP